MAGGGILGGLGDAVDAGINTYRNLKETQRQQGLLALEQGKVLNQGLIQNDSGGYDQSPWKQAQQDAEQRESEFKTSGFEPGGIEYLKRGIAEKQAGVEAGRYETTGPQAELDKNLLGTVAPGVTIPQGMSPAQIGQSKDLIREASGIEGAKIKAAGTNARLDEQRNKNAAQAGQTFEKDPIITNSKKSLNSLERAVSILNNTNKPVLANDLNLAYNDYINSVTADGNATEGKVKRELPETFESDWNALKTRFSQFDDIRKDPTGQKLIEMLKQNVSTVHGDLAKAIEDQAANIHDSFQYNTNQKVKDTIKSKLKNYAPNKYTSFYGGPGIVAPQSSTAAPAQKFGQDVLDYAKSHNITADQAQSIKDKRTGGK